MQRSWTKSIVTLFAVAIVTLVALLFAVFLPADSTPAYAAEPVEGTTTTEQVSNASGVMDADALKAAVENGGEVVLGGDIKANVVIPEGKTVTLDLNGHTLTNDGDHTIINYGTLTVEDSSTDKTGKVDNVTHGKGALVNYGVATLSGGTFTRSKEASISSSDGNGNSWYTLKNYGEMTIDEGVTVTTGSPETSTGEYSSLISNGFQSKSDYNSQKDKVTTTNVAKLTINGGKFSGGLNTVKNDEVYSDDDQVLSSTLVITGGEFTNTAQHVILNYGDAKISGGTFDAPSASAAIWNVASAGDASYSKTLGKADITGGTFNGGTYGIVGMSGAQITVSGNTSVKGEYAVVLNGNTTKAELNGGTYDGALFEQYADTLSVSSGDFDRAFDLDLLAPDSSLYIAADGKYTACSSSDTSGSKVVLVADGKGYASVENAANDGVAAIVGTNGYKSVQSAVNAAVSGEAVKLIGDVTINKDNAGGKLTLTYTDGTQKTYPIGILINNKNITLDLAGHTIKLDTAYGIYGVGNLTLTSSEETRGEIVAGEGTNAISVTKAEQAIIENVNINGGATAPSSNLELVSVSDSSLKICNSNVVLDFYSNGTSYQGQAISTYNSDLTLDGVTVDADSAEWSYGIAFRGNYDTQELKDALQNNESMTFKTLTIKNSKIYAQAFAVAGNGALHGTVFNITGSELIGRDGTAIYHPQYGEMTIGGATTIEGASGIEMRAGKLVIESGNVNVTATGAFTVDANGNGSTASGVAVAVSQHTTDLPIDVVIGAGTYSATGDDGKAFYETDTVSASPDSNGVTVALKGGNYTAPVVSENKKSFVSGGTFSKGVDLAYVADGQKVGVKPDGGMEVADEISGEGYDAIYSVSSDDSAPTTATVYTEDALRAALADEDISVVRLGKDIEIGASEIEINRAVTLDLGANKLSRFPNGSTYYISVKASNVKITADKRNDDTPHISSLNGIYIADGISNVSINNLSVLASGIAVNIEGATSVTINGATIKSYKVGVLASNDSGVNIVDSSVSATVYNQYLANEVNAIEIVSGADVTISGKSIIKAFGNNGVKGSSGAGIFISGKSEGVNDTRLILMDNTEVTADAYGIVGNGTHHGTYIEIKDNAVVKVTNFAIYHPQIGELNISGNAQITGASGIEMRAGQLIVSGSPTVTATDPEYAVNPNPDSSGPRFAGVALGVSRYFEGSDRGVTLDISGGTFVAQDKGYAFYEKDIAVAGAEDNTSLSFAGATFNGDLYSENEVGFIKSGTFTKGVELDYIEAGRQAGVKADGGMEVASTISGEGYDAIYSVSSDDSAPTTATVYTADALNDAVSAGVDVVLGCDITADVVVPKDVAVTLDLNGHTLTNSSNHTIINYGTLTITDGSADKNGTVDNVTHGRGALVNYGVATLSGGTITASTGVEFRAGTLTITGGTITATGEFAADPNGNGATTSGVAVAMMQHTTERDLTLNITGGEFNGAYAVYQQNIQNNDSGTLTMSLTGGTFNGNVDSENCTEYISGGLYSVKPAAEAFKPGFDGVEYDGYYVVIKTTTDDVAALLAARIDAQADVRTYAAVLGIDWKAMEALVDTDDVAAAALDAYNAIGNATSEGYVAIARSAAMDALDAYAAAMAESELEAAKLKAQTTVKMYIASADIGGWTNLLLINENGEIVEKDAVAPIFAMYDMIEKSTTVADIDAYMWKAISQVDTYVNALENWRKAAADEVTAAAQETAENANDAVVVPTSVYAAINGAVNYTEVNAYKTNALAEIADIRAYRADIAEQGSELDLIYGTLTEFKNAFDALDASLTGENNAFGTLLKDVQDAITTAQNAITGGTDESSESLASIKSYLKNTIYKAMTDFKADVDTAFDDLGSNLAAYGDVLIALRDALVGDGTDGSVGKIDEILADIADAQSDITNIKTTVGSLATTEDLTTAVTDIKGALTVSEGKITSAITAAQNAITSAIASVRTDIDALETALAGYESDFEGLSGTLAQINSSLGGKIDAAQADIDAIKTAIDALGTPASAAAVTELATAIDELKAAVDEISVSVSAPSAVETVKTEATADIAEWLNAYVDEIVNSVTASNGKAYAAAVTFAPALETTDGDLYAKLLKAFDKDNADLVLKYYNDALTAIDAATTADEVNTAVATFKAQVASVEAASGNTSDLTVVYVLLIVVLVVLVVAVVVAAVLSRKRRVPVGYAPAPTPAPAPATSETTEQTEKAAPAEKAEVTDDTAATAVEPEEAPDEDAGERVVINASVKTFDEAYDEMSDTLKDMFEKVREYALSKNGATGVRIGNGVRVKRGSKQIVKLTVRRGYPVAMFVLENEMLKDYRRTAGSSAKLKVPATELVLREPSDLDAAYMMVDLAVRQLDADVEAAKERRRELLRERRRQRREAMEAAKAAQAAQAEATTEQAEPAATEQNEAATPEQAVDEDKTE